MATTLSGVDDVVDDDAVDDVDDDLVVDVDDDDVEDVVDDVDDDVDDVVDDVDDVDDVVDVDGDDGGACTRMMCAGLCLWCRVLCVVVINRRLPSSVVVLVQSPLTIPPPF